MIVNEKKNSLLSGFSGGRTVVPPRGREIGRAAVSNGCH